MKKIFCLLIIFLSSLLTCSLFTVHSFANTGASFLKIGVGARAIGMGQAFSAIADDVNAIHWNPAGISQVTQQAISAMHTDWIADISYDFVGYVHPSRLGTFGGSLVYLSQGKIEGRDENRELTEEFEASDIALTMSFANQAAISGQLVNYGINLKLIQQQIEYERAVGIAFDLGLLTRLQNYPITFGLTIQNLGPQMTFIREGYNLPLTMSLGAGYVLGGMTLALDIKQQVYEETTNVSIGTEYFLLQSLVLRAGYLANVISGTNTNVDTDLSVSDGLGAGFGLELFGVNTDYSFTPYGDLGNTHRLSVSLKF